MVRQVAAVGGIRTGQKNIQQAICKDHLLDKEFLPEITGLLQLDFQSIENFVRGYTEGHTFNTRSG